MTEEYRGTAATCTDHEGTLCSPDVVNEFVGLVGEADGVGVPLNLQALQPTAVLGEGLHDLVHVHPTLHLQEPSVGRAQHAHPETATHAASLTGCSVSLDKDAHPETATHAASLGEYHVTRTHTLKQPPTLRHWVSTT